MPSVSTGMEHVSSLARTGISPQDRLRSILGGSIGNLCVLLLLQQFLTEHQLESWGWRIPFVIGGLMAIGVYRLRRGLKETDAFEESAAVKEQPRSSGWNLIAKHPREVLLVMALTAGGTLAFYAYSTYMQKFLVNSAGFGRQTATAIMASALFIYMLLQPMAGLLSDRIGRKPLLVGFGVTGVLFTTAIFTALENVTSSFDAFLLVLAGLVIVTGYTSINAIVKAELFPANIRALGVALPYALANTLFGGTAEYAALWMKQAGMEGGFYWYVTAMIAVSLIVYLRMPDTRKISQI
ncbi:general substrate transporter [Sphingobium sp. MI1205]|nr:general substrate transporter [Sphingobium sp. MI1205]